MRRRRDWWMPARLLVRATASLIGAPLFWMDMFAIAPSGPHYNRHERFVDGAESLFFYD